MNKQQKLECNCEFGTIDDDTVKLVKETLKSGECLEEVLESYKKIDKDTRTGHYWGCPLDIQEYNPGEFYCNSTFMNAKSNLLPLSNWMLETGLINKEHHSYSDSKDTEYVGVYRKKDE